MVVTESFETDAGTMLPVPAPEPNGLTSLPDEVETELPRDATDSDITPLVEPIDADTAGELQDTRAKFYAVRAAGAANRIEQGHLLIEAQAQLAKYGTGTFTKMLLAPPPDGFGFKSATSAYELIAEAKGNPKRSHGKRSDGASTPGRSNEQPPAALPLNLGFVTTPATTAESLDSTDELPEMLDTSHTHVYVALPCKGVYVPKADVVGFTAWLEKFSTAGFSEQFLAWYHAANTGSQEESNAPTPAVQ